jgi:hypothetical protein
MRLELESSAESNVALFGRTGGRRLLMLLHLVHHAGHSDPACHRHAAGSRGRGLRVMRAVAGGCLGETGQREGGGGSGDCESAKGNDDELPGVGTPLSALVGAVSVRQRTQ